MKWMGMTLTLGGQAERSLLPLVLGLVPVRTGPSPEPMKNLQGWESTNFGLVMYDFITLAIFDLDHGIELVI